MLKPFAAAALALAATSPALAVEALSSATPVLHSDPRKIGGIEVANLPERIDSRPAVTAAVPEPGTWAMMLAGFGLVGVIVRRRRLRAA